MPIVKYVNLIRKMDKLIKLKATGCPKELAHKLEISERSVYDHINEMKELGAPIEYDPGRKSYVYVEEGNFEICFKSKK